MDSPSNVHQHAAQTDVARAELEEECLAVITRSKEALTMVDVLVNLVSSMVYCF